MWEGRRGRKEGIERVRKAEEGQKASLRLEKGKETGRKG